MSDISFNDDIGDILNSPPPVKKDVRKSVSFAEVLDSDENFRTISDDEDIPGNTLEKDSISHNDEQKELYTENSHSGDVKNGFNEERDLEFDSNLNIEKNSKKNARVNAVTFDDDDDDSFLLSPRASKSTTLKKDNEVLADSSKKKTFDSFFRNDQVVNEELSIKKKSHFEKDFSFNRPKSSEVSKNTRSDSSEREQSEADSDDFGSYQPSFTKSKKAPKVKQSAGSSRPKSAPAKKNPLDFEADIFDTPVASVPTKASKPQVGSGFVSKYEAAEIDFMHKAVPSDNVDDSATLNLEVIKNPSKNVHANPSADLSPSSKSFSPSSLRRGRSIDDLFSNIEVQIKPPPATQSTLLTTPSSAVSTADIQVYENKIKKIELEKDHLKEVQELLVKKHKEEINLLKEAQEKENMLSKESSKRREESLQEEIQTLVRQNANRLREFDEERSKWRSEMQMRLDEASRDKTTEIVKLSEKHRADIDAIRVSSSNYDNLHQVIERISTLCDRLGNLDNREAMLRSKEKTLHSMEQYDSKALQEILHKLTSKVDQQSRSEQIISDLAAQVIEEQRILSRERTDLKAVKSSESSKVLELETARRIAEDDRKRTLELESRLREEKASMYKERAFIDEESYRLRRLEEKIKSDEETSRNKFQAAERMEKQSSESLAKAEAMSAENSRQLQQIQTELSQLRNKERQLAEERMRLSAERKTLEERAAATILCSNCRLPVRDSGVRVSSGSEFVHLARLRAESFLS